MTASNVVLEAFIEAVKTIEEESLGYCLFGDLAIQAYKRIRSTKETAETLGIERRINDHLHRYTAHTA